MFSRLGYSLKQTFSQLWKNKGTNFAATIAIIAMMLILGLFLVAFVNVDLFANVIKQDYNVVEVFFAEGADGSHYVYYHPTDVRFVRENYDNIEEQMKDWTMLNEWAWGEVRDTFVADNAGLTAETVEGKGEEMKQRNDRRRFYRRNGWKPTGFIIPGKVTMEVYQLDHELAPPEIVRCRESFYFALDGQYRRIRASGPSAVRGRNP